MLVRLTNYSFLLGFLLISSVIFSLIFTFQISADDTTTVEILDQTGDVGWGSGVAVGTDGFARIAYYDATNSKVKYVQCENDDCSNKITTDLDTGITEDEFGAKVAIKIGSDHFARIAYYDDSTGSLIYAVCSNDSCSSPTVTTVISGGGGGSGSGNVGKWASMVLDSSDNAYITYHKGGGDGSSGSQQVAVHVNSGGSGCTNSDDATHWTCTDVSTPGGWGGSAIALGSDGKPRIAYHTWDGNGGGDEDIEFIQCTSVTCSTISLNSPVTLDTESGHLGFEVSMVLDPDDNTARISYFHGQSNTILRYIQCTNADCTTKNTNASVATISPNALSLSSALDSNELVRISYSTDGVGIKYAVCNNEACSAPTISTIDSSTAEFNAISLALTSEDLFLMTYYDADNNDLKYAFSTASSPPDPAPSSSSSSSSSGFTESSGPPPCSASLPKGTPDLFQINTTSTTAKLFFSPLGDPITFYNINYGLTSNSFIYGDFWGQGRSSGVLSRTINYLSPNTTYYFKVAPGNDCVLGPYSNILKAKTQPKGSRTTKMFYEHTGKK
jgi:hypothetical protein